jgi:hypothetical protein
MVYVSHTYSVRRSLATCGVIVIRLPASAFVEGGRRKEIYQYMDDRSSLGSTRCEFEQRLNSTTNSAIPHTCLLYIKVQRLAYTVPVGLQQKPLLLLHHGSIQRAVQRCCRLLHRQCKLVPTYRLLPRQTLPPILLRRRDRQAISQTARQAECRAGRAGPTTSLRVHRCRGGSMRIVGQRFTRRPADSVVRGALSRPRRCCTSASTCSFRIKTSTIWCVAQRL